MWGVVVLCLKRVDFGFGCGECESGRSKKLKSVAESKKSARS